MRTQIDLLNQEHIDQGPPSASSRVDPAVRVRLLGTFELSVDDSPIPLPLSAQRLIAFLALSELPLQRSRVGGTLWPDKPEARAMASLRSVLWRVRQPGVAIVDASGTTLRLVESVGVDTRLLTAGLALDGPDAPLPGVELLTGWYEDWVLMERERLRNHQLFGLEALCRDLADAGSTAQAIDVGLRLVAMEPLREGSHRALVAAHLRDNNLSEAVRQFDRFVDLSQKELGVLPSAELIEMSTAFINRLPALATEASDHRRTECRATSDQTESN